MSRARLFLRRLVMRQALAGRLPWPRALPLLDRLEVER